MNPSLHYYEDLSVGFSWRTSGIVITEAHIVQFAGLSGDFFDVHMDDVAAQELGFPKRIAHGLLCLAITDGLKNRAEVRLAGIASLNWNWNFRAPVFAGDRLIATLTIVEKRLARDGRRGVVTTELTVENQNGVTVQDGRNILLMRTRPE